MASAGARSRSVSSSNVPSPSSATNMSLRKRPCGVSSAAQIARPGATLVVSLEIRPCRNSTRSAPPTAMTLRWGSRLNREQAHDPEHVGGERVLGKRSARAVGLDAELLDELAQPLVLGSERRGDLTGLIGSGSI